VQKQQQPEYHLLFDCKSFKVLSIMTGSTGCINGDCNCGETKLFIMSVSGDSDDAKVLALCGRIPSAVLVRKYKTILANMDKGSIGASDV
jgi:hypothetical protein